MTLNLLECFFSGGEARRNLGRGSFGRPLSPLEAPEEALVMLSSDCDCSVKIPCLFYRFCSLAGASESKRA